MKCQRCNRESPHELPRIIGAYKVRFPCLAYLKEMTRAEEELVTMASHSFEANLIIAFLMLVMLGTVSRWIPAIGLSVIATLHVRRAYGAWRTLRALRKSVDMRPKNGAVGG